MNERRFKKLIGNVIRETRRLQGGDEYPYDFCQWSARVMDVAVRYMTKSQVTAFARVHCKALSAYVQRQEWRANVKDYCNGSGRKAD